MCVSVKRMWSCVKGVEDEGVVETDDMNIQLGWFLDEGTQTQGEVFKEE